LDYQLLRCLGFRDRVVVATIVTETYLLGILAIIGAIPIGILTAQYTDWRISTVWFQVVNAFRVSDFVLTFAPALILLPAVALLMARTVLRQPLDEFMRSRELG
jgi:ABC-type antimicrobial peptide transport system permease subunit